MFRGKGGFYGVCWAFMNKICASEIDEKIFLNGNSL